MIDYLKGFLELALKAYNTYVGSDRKISDRFQEGQNTDNSKKTIEVISKVSTIDDSADLKEKFLTQRVNHPPLKIS